MSAKRWMPLFEWWNDVAEGDRVSADFGGRSFTALAPFAGAVGIALPPGPKDWAPEPEEWLFHAITRISRSEYVRFRVRHAGPDGALSPLTEFINGESGVDGVLGILKKGSHFRTLGNIRASL